MKKGQGLYQRAKKIIPGGTQLLSKRPEMFSPKEWPSYYQKAKGCKVWSLDGKEYIDASLSAVGSCILGYADRDVDKAVIRTVRNGSMATLNSPEEVSLAEKLCEIHSWAHMVRFARTGGEAMAIAVRIARAKTRKDIVLFCGYHGWHDWYLASNLAKDSSLDGHLLPGLKARGVPRVLKGTSIPFCYNDTEGFLKLIKTYKERIAAVVMEPVRNHYPHKGFLETIRRTTRQRGICLIFDEITAGWRLTYGGAHLKFKVFPDVAVFAKGMSNGYPMAAIIGRKEMMQAAQETFISSTYWTEGIGPAAALATIKKLKEKKVSDFLQKTGQHIQHIWRTAADKHALDISVSGIYPLGHFTFLGRDSLIYKTLFTQLMLQKGFLATTAFFVSFAHQKGIIDKYEEAVHQVFAVLSRMKEKRNPKRFLKGPVCHSGFKRLT